MHLDLGEYDAALALYDADIRAEKTDDYRDISNGASLLSRLELEGVDVGDRWEELADLSEPGRRTDASPLQTCTTCWPCAAANGTGAPSA
jgi:hypothetical protein